MLDGRKIIPLAYRGESRFHTSAVANIASLIRTALDHPATHILNAADPAAPTVREIGDSIAGHLSYKGRILPIDVREDETNGDVGWSPWSVPAPYILSTAAATALGYKPITTYEASVAKICDWLVDEYDAHWTERFPVLAGYPRDLFNYTVEDQFLAARDLRMGRS